MTPFWASFFEQLRDCGRNGTVFLITLGTLFIALALVAIIYANNLQQYIVKALPFAGVLIFVWTLNAVRRARRQSTGGNISGRLSDDELIKARSKLGRKQGR